MDKLPVIFIGSSTESLAVAEALSDHLEREMTTQLWTGDVFKPGTETLQSLLDAAAGCDFAVLVLGDDDRLVERGVEYPAPRDNVVFELGLFMGRIGPPRTFFLYDAARNPKRPTDVLGITGLSYRLRDPDSVHAGDLATVAGKIKRQARELGRLRHRTARPSVYWCAPHTNVQRNRDAATILGQHGISLLLPHELVQRSLGQEARDDPAAVRQVCLDGIRTADILAVDLDFYGLDSAWELGFAEAIGTRVVGINWNEVGVDEARPINRRRYYRNLMHGWDQLTATPDLDEIAAFCAGKVVHVCGALENERAMKELRQGPVMAAASDVIFPMDVLDLGAMFARDFQWQARQEAVHLLASSEVILTILPRYGMDTSWQLGYAAGLGKPTVGWIFEDTLPSIAQEQALDHWMHGWRQKPRLTDMEDLAALVNGLVSR